jgi:C4-dicarboxylate-specific signal transduction histidine kinase
LERLLAEHHQLQLQHPAPCGALATQMAHEVNPPLAAIRLSLEAMAQPCSPADTNMVHVLADLDRISAYLANARQLTQIDPPRLQAVTGQAMLHAATQRLAHPVNATDALAEVDSPRTLELAIDAGKDGVTVRVQDNDPGIAAHVMAHLFQPFVSNTTQGLGIGLALAWRLAQRCGCKAASPRLCPHWAIDQLHCPGYKATS